MVLVRRSSGLACGASGIRSDRPEDISPNELAARPLIKANLIFLHPARTADDFTSPTKTTTRAAKCRRRLAL